MVSRIISHKLGCSSRTITNASRLPQSMGDALYRILLSVSFALILSGCSSHKIVPPGEIPQQSHVSVEDEQYGQEVFGELVDKYPLSTNDQLINRVEDVTRRLADAAGAGNNTWHVYVLIDDNFKNAAATRGNYIFVWTGLLKEFHNDDELAAILAHEMAHVLAGHTAATPQEAVSEILGSVAESVSGQIMTQHIGVAIGAELVGLLVRELANAMIVNPDSQLKELEADQIGLYLMADAKYDPSKAVEFWSRIQYDPNFSSSLPGFLSTHPAPTDRHQKLEALLPGAMERYHAALAGNTTMHSQSNKSSSSYPQPAFATPTPQPAGPDRQNPNHNYTSNNQPSPTPSPIPAPLGSASVAPSAADSSAPDKNDPSVWQVNAEMSFVYAEPSRSAEPLAELTPGTKVTLYRKANAGWWEISDPVHGYIQSSSITPP